MQATTGRDTSPIARDNNPIGIFKSEKPKAAAKAPTAKPTDEQAPVSQAPEQVLAQPQSDLDALVAQRKALAEQIKALKAAIPTASRLEKEVASQEQSPNKGLIWCIGSMMRRRIAAGQPADEAIAGVLEIVRQIAARAVVSEPTPAEPTAAD